MTDSRQIKRKKDKVYLSVHRGILSGELLHSTAKYMPNLTKREGSDLNLNGESVEDSIGLFF